LQTAKDNVELLTKIITTWSVSPLFDRTEDKGSTLLQLKDREERVKKRYEEIEQAGIKIHSLIDVMILI